MPLKRRIRLFLFLILIIGLHLICLESDAYSRLSWSGALLTDEGFYCHNARNLILFGTTRTDEFNNMLIMPLLHLVQVGVFKVWGVGLLQLRMISVVCGLLTLLVFYSAARQVFGWKTASIASVILGLDHVNLLYHRMGLMDTPAALLMTLSFFAFVRGLKHNHRIQWGILCGICLGTAYATRGLSALLIPAPFIAIWFSSSSTSFRDRFAQMAPVLFGLVLSLGLYWILWLHPHHDELTKLNTYYLYHQILPHSFRHWITVVSRFAFGDDRGMCSYLMRYSPVQFLSCSLIILWWFELGRKSHLSRPVRATALFLLTWVLTSWAFQSSSAYAPSRYNVLYYPAMALLAALSMQRMKPLLHWLAGRRYLSTLFALFVAYHAAIAFIHPQRLWQQVLVGVITLAAGAMALNLASHWSLLKYGEGELGASEEGAASKRPYIRLLIPFTISRRTAFRAAYSCWALVNLFWTVNWLSSLSYSQRDAERWLTATLPPGSVVIGDVAPGITIGTSFKAINVIPPLCNGDHPVEHFAPSPRYVAILDEKFKEGWWVEHYPDIVAPSNRIRLFKRLVRFPVGIYPVKVK